MTDLLPKVHQASTSSSSDEVSLRYEDEEVEINSGQNVESGEADAVKPWTVVAFTNGDGSTSGKLEPPVNSLKLERAKTESHRHHNVRSEETAQFFDNIVPLQQKKMSSRGANFSNHEDIRLAKIYVEISQNSIIGVRQKTDTLWQRVTTQYNANLPPNSKGRCFNALEKRWGKMAKAVKTLIQCYKQVELMNPSGTSEDDRMDRARELYRNMPNKECKVGFTYDHVWNILKNFPKFHESSSSTRHIFLQQNRINVSESNAPTPESDVPESPGLSDFHMDLTDADVDGSSSKRPISVKNAKAKRKMEEELQMYRDERDQLLGILTRNEQRRDAATVRQEQIIAMQQMRLDIDRQRMEDRNRRTMYMQQRNDERIMLIDLSTIFDPGYRTYIEGQRVRIIEEAQQLLRSQPTNNLFGKFFPNNDGDNDDFGDY